MYFGYIKINGQISQIFINKSDEEILAVNQSVKQRLADMNVKIEWNNRYTEKSMFDLLEFLDVQ